ncbi:hypothetical protein GCM10008939_04360 [Deinococcus aquiradiocola]|uniref:Uncharacterized protein n=1 Tax=Deinococcus aquiradiocola TaxID=393059 RepID=A0A917P638_9DEIO|nr:hypothetical protein GCM10008939_04360 [Deinococcus aquiradiocola]
MSFTVVMVMVSLLVTLAFPAGFTPAGALAWGVRVYMGLIIMGAQEARASAPRDSNITFFMGLLCLPWQSIW